ncbi:MAG TPA: hypothetical protein VG897_13115 [Terriglobales bacterium]|nr:hypothetical protein [Terriglobales bacterium]
MSAPTFSKEPWVDGGSIASAKREIQSGNRAVCEVWTRTRLDKLATGRVPQFAPDPEGEANFRLILAAPELLAAAKEVIEACNPIPLNKAQHIAFALLTNAIAKAEGTQ